jgi:hypothetical protein
MRQAFIEDHARSAFIETARLGAVDYVTDIGSTSYQLSSGGWIPVRFPSSR